MKKGLFFVLAVVLGFEVSAAISTERLTDGHDVIWALAPISKTEILFTTRGGKFKILDLKNRKVSEVKSELKVLNQGQGGLLDVVTHPDFVNSRKIYFTYSCERPGNLNSTCLAFATLTKDLRSLVNLTEIFSAKPASNSKQHFGSRLAWDSTGHLFMTMGDRYILRDSAQSLQTHLGKVLRLDQNGKAVKGNPFLDQPEALSEIYSYGHRNPQGLFFDKAQNALWESEHGARDGDELNKIEAGKNYGWPVINHGVDYDGSKIGEGKEKPGMEQPYYFYVPSIAPSGLLKYSGKKFPQYKDSFFLGALVLTHLNRVDSNRNEERLFANLNERIRSVIESSDGDIFFSTDSGRIYRIK